MKEICFGCVVYKEAVNYLPDFFSSVFSQGDSEFDILVLNDNLEKSLLECIISECSNEKANIIVIDSKANTPSELRVELLKNAKERNYKLIILGDCDDKFALNRVEKNRISFMSNKSYAFYYNDLKKFDGKVAMKFLPEITEKIEDIGEYNYLGLSNSAINLEILDMDFIESLRECKSNIFDWYFFSRIILNGGTGVKVNDTYTYYRIHDKNIAGLNTVEKEAIIHEKEIKLQHYGLLQQYSEYMGHLYECYKSSHIYIIERDSCEINMQYWWSNLKAIVEGEKNV